MRETKALLQVLSPQEVCDFQIEWTQTIVAVSLGGCQNVVFVKTLQCYPLVNLISIEYLDSMPVLIWS